MGYLSQDRSERLERALRSVERHLRTLDDRERALYLLAVGAALVVIRKHQQAIAEGRRYVPDDQEREDLRSFVKLVERWPARYRTKASISTVADMARHVALWGEHVYPDVREEFVDLVGPFAERLHARLRSRLRRPSS